jgi:hypothetical protein
MVFRRNERNLSGAEKERLCYLLGDESAAGAFEAQATLEDFVDNSNTNYLEEAKGAVLCEEDWLQDELSDLVIFAKEMRKGERQDKLLRIIETLTQKRDDALKSGEHVIEQLDKLDKELTKLF